MRLYEYEGKELYKSLNIPVPPSGLASTGEEARRISNELGYPVVIKAQVLQGGRGKAGLVLLADNENEAKDKATQILSKINPNEMVLIEKKVDANMESYMGITIDDVSGHPVLVMNIRGGINIEKYAEDDEIVSEIIDPIKGLQYYQVMNTAIKAGYQGSLLPKITELAYKMYQVFKKYEADTVEINPVLINTDTDEIWAGDAKVIGDDYTLFRQPKLTEFKNKRKTDNLDDSKFVYVDLGGNIGVISSGASNTMMLVDTIKYLGGEPGNFMDIIGSGSIDAMTELYTALLKKYEANPKIKATIINFTFVAQPIKNFVMAIVAALKAVQPKKRVISCIRASGAAVIALSLEDANKLLVEAGAECFISLEEAIQEAVKISKSAGLECSK